MQLSSKQEKIQKRKKLLWQKYKSAATYRFFAPCYMEQFRILKEQWNNLLNEEKYSRT